MDPNQETKQRHNLATRIRNTYAEYPRQFWLLVTAAFIDWLGGMITFPFLALYITRKFGVSMTTVGAILGLFSAANMVGILIGGTLSDHLGRKRTLIAGLIISALTSLSLGLINSMTLLIGCTAIVGLFVFVGAPAQQAMVADLLPEEKRAQGFGILRIAFNLALTLGPMIGGLLAGRSYLLLFICDAILSTVTAGIVFFTMKETQPTAPTDAVKTTFAQTFVGYIDVFRDTNFTLLICICTLVLIAYKQISTTLGVYMRDFHGLPEHDYGYILSISAVMVILFQFNVTRRISRYRPLHVMALGALLYAIGLAMYGFVSSFALFALAIVIITTGELIYAPTEQAQAALLAPQDMRGRYMAVFGFTGTASSMIGPLLAGIAMDNTDPRWVWYGSGLACLAGAGMFILLQRRNSKQQKLKSDAE